MGQWMREVGLDVLLDGTMNLPRISRVEIQDLYPTVKMELSDRYLTHGSWP